MKTGVQERELREKRREEFELQGCRERGKGGKVEKLGTEGGGRREFVLALQKTTLRV